MSPAEFVESCEGFSSLSYTDQTKRFCWYVEAQRKRSDFTGADILDCFKRSNSPHPTSVSPFLTSLHKQRFLVKKGKGRYGMAQQARRQLDGQLGRRPTTVRVDNLLAELPEKISSSCERVYLDEALTCFRHKAFRAAVVMTWNLAYDYVCNLILSDHIGDFNTQLPRSFPKADISEVKKRDDFSALKESQVLQVAKSANIITNSLHKVLREKLDRRNVAAHPSGVTISPHTAEEFILDLVQNVVLKL